jgi:hypothetical protein
MMSTTSGITNMRAASMPKVVSGGSSPVSAQQKISNMFNQIDSTGTGRITKEQFEQAFNKLNLPASVKGMGLEAAFSKLDPSGSGVVSKQDFIKGMESLMAKVGSAQHKEAAHEAKAAAGNMATQSPSSNIPPPPGGGPIGNTINIAA